MSAYTRALIYGVLGWGVDRAFTTITRYRRTGRVTSPALALGLLPIYALALPLCEPLHEAMRRAPLMRRAVVYGLGSVAAEYTIGALIRRARGRAPWDYSGARWSVGGLTRLDYTPLWAIAGLALEPLHDRLTKRTPPGSLHH